MIQHINATDMVGMLYDDTLSLNYKPNISKKYGVSSIRVQHILINSNMFISSFRIKLNGCHTECKKINETITLDNTILHFDLTIELNLKKTHNKITIKDISKINFVIEYSLYNGYNLDNSDNDSDNDSNSHYDSDDTTYNNDIFIKEKELIYKIERLQTIKIKNSNPSIYFSHNKKNYFYHFDDITNYKIKIELYIDNIKQDSDYYVKTIKINKNTYNVSHSWIHNVNNLEHFNKIIFPTCPPQTMFVVYLFSN